MINVRIMALHRLCEIHTDSKSLACGLL
jgi:hypothetical protein